MKSWQKVQICVKRTVAVVMVFSDCADGHKKQRCVPFGREIQWRHDLVKASVRRTGKGDISCFCV